MPEVGPGRSAGELRRVSQEGSCRSPSGTLNRRVYRRQVALGAPGRVRRERFGLLGRYLLLYKHIKHNILGLK